MTSSVQLFQTKSWGLKKDAHVNEFLNDIKCSGIPNHKLRLKIDVLQC